MNRLLTTPAFVCALAVALSACGGGGHTAIPSPVSANVPSGTAPQSVAGAIPFGANLASGATYLGRAQLATVGLDVHMALANETGLYQYAKEANDPTSRFTARG